MFADLHFGELPACKPADSLSCRRFHGNVGDLEENGGRAAFSQGPQLPEAGGLGNLTRWL